MSDSEFKIELLPNAGNLWTARAHFGAYGSTRRTDVDSALLADLELQALKEPTVAGKKLFQALFQGEILELFAKRPDKEVSRIVVGLPMPEGEQALSVHFLPWECLHGTRSFLGSSEKSPIVRRIDSIQVSTPPEPVFPIRVLFTSANPPDSEKLQLKEEELEVRTALRAFGEKVDLKVLHSVTLGTLKKAYSEARNQGRPFQIWHHCGHGVPSSESRDRAHRQPDSRDAFRRAGSRHEPTCRLLLHGKGGGSHVVEQVELDNLIADNDELLMVVLNVCWGGAPDGLAARLASLSVPNTLGFNREIGDGDALDFCRELYSKMSEGSIERACCLWRQGHPSSSAKLIHYSRSSTALLLKPPQSQKNEEGESDAGGGAKRLLSLESAEEFIFVSGPKNFKVHLK